MRDVRSKVVFITGAAMGMGRLFAERFGGDGAKLVLVDLNAEALKATADELSRRGLDVRWRQLDVTDAKAVYEAAKWVQAEVGTVTVLVNNAGVVYKGKLHEQDDTLIARTFDVNVKALCWTMKAFLPGMLAQDEGHILNMASASGFIGVPGLAAYAASKWAVIGLSESVRYEVQAQSKNIKMTIACPSYVATGMFEGVRPPRLTKMLTPEQIVDRVYDSFKKDKVYVLEPWLTKITPAVKGLLPVDLYDRVQEAFGVQTGMETFRGRD